MPMSKCIKCGSSLTADEIALYKKLVNRGAESYMCISCCAEYFNVKKQLLFKKIEEFKKMGCTLFE